MTNSKNTKRALLMSLLSIIICFAMLIGTTFAWFTDSVTSSGNKIQAGELKVDLYLWENQINARSIKNNPAPIFNIGEKAQNNPASTLWEPGKTQVVYLSIKNEGTLDLKYKVALDVKDVSKHLYKVMSYKITPDARYGEIDGWDGNNAVAVVPGINATGSEDVALKAGKEHFFALSVHMDEEAGNEYQGGEVDFDIKVLAGQLTSEADSFSSEYDKLASYAGTGYGVLDSGEAAEEIPIRNEDDAKVGSVIVPVGAAEEGATLKATIDDSPYVGNFTVSSGLETKVLDIKVEGLKENNTTPVKVQVRMPEGLDFNTFTLYHYDEEIAFTYDPYSGYISFETLTFSPFTILYDKESVYVAPSVDGVPLPQAVVSKNPEYINTELPWGSYGAWSPTAGLDAELESAYTFKCAETADEAVANPFANWYCDFYVKLDRDLAANQIFLGGNYGVFGWVGFHNGDVTLEADQELPLLGSVVSNEWTYAMIAANVGEFICGVGDVDDALSGAKFTVMLRLTNPENPEQFFNVQTVEYTFE